MNQSSIDFAFYDFTEQKKTKWLFQTINEEDVHESVSSKQQRNITVATESIEFTFKEKKKNTSMNGP